MKVILLVFLLQLVHRTAYRIPINEAESNATREDDVLAQQDVKRNEGEKRNKRRNCNVVPFDVQCHGRCPYTENEWNSMRRSWNCSNERDGATYHCTDPEDDSGDPIEACGVPKYCYKGKGPVILLSNGKTADIDCKWCPEEYFNPHESIWSANVSKCPETRKNCGHPRKIECDIVTGVERYWTDSKCECDTKNNYFPLFGENKCTDQYLYCKRDQPCKKSPEGFDQIYTFSVSEGKYVCQRGCNEGFEFKTPQSKNCEPVQVNITTFDNETTIYDRSSLMPTTPKGTTTLSSPPTTTTTVPHEEEDAGVSSGKELGIVIAAVLVCVPIVVIYLAIGCCCYYINVKRTCGFKGNTRRKYQAEFRREGNSSSQSNVQLQQEPLMSSPDVTDPILQAVKYVFCWPCNLPCFKEAPKMDLTSLPDNKEVRVMVGDPLELAIGISGSPTPTVTWLKDGKHIERATKSINDGVAKLEIRETERCDTGKYQIKVANVIGSETVDISVIVLEAPKMDLSNLPDNKEVHVMVGDPLELAIGISGSPTSTVTWLKDGKRIERATKSINDGVAKLEIRKAERSDTGKYQIKVENEIGSDTVDISVMVLEAPKMDLTSLPDNKEVRVMVGDPLEMAIGISGSPTPTVTWLKDGKHIERATKSINDGVAKLEIRKAERSDTGQYQIKVANVIGSDTVDISVIVLEAPNLDLTSLPDNKEVHVMVGKQLKLVIGISGSPSPTVTWLKDGKHIERATKSINDGVAKLEIRETEGSDTGKYQIKVANVIGSDTVDISVIVLEAPKMDLTSLPDNKEVRVMVGDPFELAIGISGSPTPIVTWLKDGKRIERMATKSINDGVAKLEIQKAERSDTGKYQIKVANVIGSDTVDISVIVLEAPKMDLTSLPDNKEVHVMVGKQLKLVIGISGSPTPTVTWLKDGKRIERATKSINDGVAKLEIQKAECSDTGKYQIKVANVYGSDTVDISVIVLEAPKMDLTSLPDKEVRVMVGDPLELAIGISGSPTPTVTWLKDGKHIERATKSINAGVAKFEIRKAERSDTGKYQIKVENEIGSDTVDISVIVLEAPKMDITNLPDNKEVRVMVGKQLRLVIGISGSPTPTVTWLKDGKRIERAQESNDDDVAKLEIPKTELSDTGKYQIKVENEIGSATADISVNVLEAPKIDHTSLPPNKEVQVVVGKPLELVIGISGSPTSTVTWLKDGKRIERVNKFINDGVAKFEIQIAECSDTGNYQMKAENEIGSDTVDISVIVLDKPGAPGVPKCKTTTEDSITLFWTPPNRDGGNPVTGYVLERREKGDVLWETRSCSVNQVTEFTIKGLQEGKEYEFRAAACNNAGIGEFSNCSEPIQVQSLQDTKRNMQDSYIFDGRLILLDSDQIRRLEESLDKEAIGKGRIGTVYRCNNQDIFGITVAVKKIKTKEHANQIRREKIVSRLMNPFLLPLLAVIEKSDEECWFISPYCENGDLYDAIKRGKNEKDEKNNTEEININNQATRVKILLQIALAIEYIHTEVPNVRGPILHKDIASKNVVLDKYLNARLIDFGLAREKDDDMSTLGGRKHYDHPKVGTGCDEDYFDFYSFGVIIREMLTSLGPEGEKNHFLKKMNSNQIAERLDKNVWKYKETRDKLNELSQMCLKEDAAWTIEDFKSNVVDTLRVMFLAFDCNIFENGGESTCHQCIINPIVSAEKSSLTKDYDNCRQKIQVCMACEKNSFLNPITCYCGAKLKSAIGSNWGALLVAGDDDNPGKAAVMKKEILELEGLVTSQAPRIIGIRQHNVKTVVPCKTNIEKMSAWTQIQKHIEAFSKDDEIDTLLIYFSCHGESSVEGNMFHLGKKEYISSDDFQKELDKLEKKDQLIIFLDRCFPPMVKFTDRKFIQINACSDKDAAVLKEEGSLFTKYVIQGLKARSEERKCSKDCQHCVDYWKPKTEYISVFALFDYVNNHLQQKAPDPYWQGQGVGKNIAFFTGEVVEVEFTLKDEKRYKRLPLKYLKHLDEVKERLFEAFGVDQKTHEVKIQKETFRQDQPYDECDTLEKVMQAWLQRLPLVVTFTAKNIN